MQHAHGITIVICVVAVLYIARPLSYAEIKDNEWEWKRYVIFISRTAYCSPCGQDGYTCSGYQTWERSRYPVIKPPTAPISQAAKEWKKISFLYKQVADVLTSIPSEICVNLHEKLHPEGYHAQKRNVCLGKRVANLDRLDEWWGEPGQALYETMRKRYPIQPDPKDCDTSDWLVRYDDYK